MKNQLKAKLVKAGKLVTGAAVAIGGSVAHAIDTTAVQASITAAETDALTTGEYVIGTVASLIVITLIIGIIKKL